MFSENELLDNAIACATNISHNAPLAIKAVKRAMREGANLPLPEALNVELTHYATLLNTQDRQEGINAFNEKRKPAFTGN
jgi:enoyl-CoA hydratase/carnithine racemase